MKVLVPLCTAGTVLSGNKWLEYLRNHEIMLEIHVGVVQTNKC